MADHSAKPAARQRNGLSKVVRVSSERLDNSVAGDLFQSATRYPHRPGWRTNATGETSREAALAVSHTAPRQADLCREVIAERGAATPEEITAILTARGHTVLLTSIRARCTGLRKQGVLRDSGKRGLGESQRCKVIAWEIVPDSERQPTLVAA